MSSPSRKNIPLAPSGKSNAQLPPSCPTKGASAVVANAGQGAMDAAVRKTSASVAYGEIVWVRRPDAGVKFKGSQRCPRAMVSQKAGSPGRNRISRKAVAWGRPVCSPLNLYARGRTFLVHHACETAGAARTRPSPRPLHFRRANEMQNLGRSAPREGSLLSYATRKTGATGPCMSATPTTRSSCSPSPSSSASRTDSRLRDRPLLHDLAKVGCEAGVIGRQHLVEALPGLVLCFPRIFFAPGGPSLVLLHLGLKLGLHRHYSTQHTQLLMVCRQKSKRWRRRGNFAALA